MYRFHSFPAFPGENPNDFYCTYSPTSGALVEDHDAGFCPPTAVVCGPSRKRNYALGESLGKRPAGKIRVESMDQGLLDKRAIWAKKRQEAGAGEPQKV
ncbi:hypothetical protein JCM24511_10072 [Saitozyma sp. JCM 24511]|nr:hypothetical protein JCM24511_10072 [Saitozyma sp. JCM 24511]